MFDWRVLLVQLGGAEFLLLTGARDLVAGENFLTMTIPLSNGVNFVKVIYDAGLDLYVMEFRNNSGGGNELLKKEDCLYSDMLQDTFEEHTGLYTTFKTRK